MIDERHEELASLYALDLLEGTERAEFESALARDPALQSLVRELREAAAALAHTAPATPPPTALRARILASIAERPPAVVPASVIRPSPSVFRSVLPWAAAACAVFAAACAGRLYFSSRTEAALAHQQFALAEVALQAARNQLEAERLLASRQVTDLNQQVGDTTRRLADTERQSATATEQLQSAQARLATAERALADARSAVAAREGQLATLTQRVEAMATAAQDLDRQLGASQERVASLTTLTRDLQSQADLANFKITTLASMLKNSPQAVAVAVWNPAKQEGLLKVDKLPALAANEDYQLWIVDPRYPNPVDGGVFTVDPQTGARSVSFKSKQPVEAINAFAVTRERKGGVPKAEGPFVLLGK